VLTRHANGAEGQWRDDLDLLLNAAGKAADVAMGYFGQEPQTWWKNNGQSPVTAADYAANDVLIDLLRSARPDYGWLSEETEDDGARRNFETLFVVDPIDGTRAFMNGFKTWCVSVAVVHKGRPVAGVLAAPALDEVFCATTSGPALRNGLPISVAALDKAPLQISAPGDAFSRLPETFRTGARRVPHIPSLAYRIAMVADGRLHATLVRPDCHDWDIAAAELILMRSGGRLLRLDGGVITYNGDSISHGVLCAAHENGMEALLAAADGVFDH
jgi:myo-inositol-1(or 4)-monophosphatase